MAVPRLFHPDLSPGRIELSRDESRHVGKVLRCRPGDPVVLFDGRGSEAAATIVGVAARSVTVEVAKIEQRPREPGIRLTLAVALPRSHRQPFLFEKCTELGVFAIWPMISEHSVVRPRPEQLEKWTRTTVEAAKQSQQAWLPQIELPCTFEDTLARAKELGTLLVTDSGTFSEPIFDRLRGISASSSLLVWIGPEGGLSSAEIRAALSAGAIGVQLGSAILRVETAALAVATLAAALRDNASTH